VTIDVEVDFAFDGDRRVGAAGFTGDDAGHLFPVHSGRMGGGVPGLNQKAIRACVHRCCGSIKNVQWRGQKVEVIRIARLGDSELPKRFGQFVRQIQESKAECRETGQ